MGDDLFQYALRLLSARAYAEAGLRRKLAHRGSPEEVEATIRRVKELGYLDDRSYGGSVNRCVNLLRQRPPPG
ncbi:hypothetical protein [Allomeiothermus silvanus]